MSWWAVYSQPGRAKAAREELLRRRLEVFFPIERVKLRRKIRNRNAYKLTREDTPVFGYYLFARGPEHEVRATPFVSGLISMEGEAVRVPDRVVEAMRELTTADEAGDIMTERDLTALRLGFSARVGDSFRFTEGPFSGYYGVISSLAKLDSSGTVGAYVDLFGRQVETEVRRNLIKPLSKAEVEQLDRAA